MAELDAYMPTRLHASYICSHFCPPVRIVGAMVQGVDFGGGWLLGSDNVVHVRADEAEQTWADSIANNMGADGTQVKNIGVVWGEPRSGKTQEATMRLPQLLNRPVLTLNLEPLHRAGIVNEVDKLRVLYNEVMAPAMGLTLLDRTSDWGVLHDKIIEAFLPLPSKLLVVWDEYQVLWCLLYECANFAFSWLFLSVLVSESTTSRRGECQSVHEGPYAQACLQTTIYRHRLV